MDAISYLGFSRETENIIKDITEEDIILGYKLVPCPECLGTGVWDFAPYISIEECVVCKRHRKSIYKCIIKEEE